MSEITIWLKPGQEVEYCPYCRGRSVWPCEVAGLWTCQGCGRGFLVRHRKPLPAQVKRSISPEQFRELQRQLTLKGGC